MSEQLVLSNGTVEAVFSTKGAELLSAKKNGNEKIWIGDPDVWGFHAPILFPICGGLKDGKYIYENREYTLGKHGYARFSEFEVESKSDTELVFLNRFDSETLEHFPFRYEFRVVYTLNGAELKVEYKVKNLDDSPMYYSVGAHEAYYCPEGIEEYSIIFDKPEDLDRSILTGNLLEYDVENIGKNVCELPLKYEYFAVDALVFLNLKSRKVVLKNRKTGDETGLDFEGHDYFLLWTKPGAKYICMEPWCGCPDFVDSSYDFKSKRGIIELNGKEEKTRTHTIAF